MRTDIKHAAAIVCAVLLQGVVHATPGGSVLAGYSLEAESLSQWRLPNQLREISGLAVTPDGRLLAVADEAAIIFELDVERGRIHKSFAYGDPVLQGDFEGIAVDGGVVYLVTSDGTIVSGREGVNGEQLTYSSYETGVGAECEIEGLATDRQHGRLLLACKELRRSRSIDDLAIFAWSIADHVLDDSAMITLPMRPILRELRMNRLNPSGLVVDAGSGHLLLVAARQRALVELSPDGQLVAVAELPLTTRHRQPEGLAILSDGRLLVADEGGNHKARLGIYRADRAKDAIQR